MNRGKAHRRRRKRRTPQHIRYVAAKSAVTAVLVLLVLGVCCGLFFGVRALVRNLSDSGRTEEEEWADYDHLDVRIPDKTVSLVMVGDMLLHTDILESGKMEDGSYNYDHLFAHTRSRIEEADVAMVNEEVILGGSELGLRGYPTFNAGYEVGDALVSAGFDVICHANNHASDMGETGLLNCLNFWRSSYPDITALGIHDSVEDRDTLHAVQINGITIAILNYTYGLNDASDIPDYMVDLLDREQVTADLTRAREVADFVIVVPHWGTEYETTPSSEQKEWAEFFLENGVDLVIGSHPHVIQPVEWMEDEAGHRMLVYYSLGNFISFTEGEGEGKGERAVGAMAEVTLTKKGGEVSISDYGVVPLVSHLLAGTGNPTVYFLSEYTEELAAESEMSKKDPSFSLESCRELCREVFGDLFRD